MWASTPTDKIGSLFVGSRCPERNARGNTLGVHISTEKMQSAGKACLAPTDKNGNLNVGAVINRPTNRTFFSGEHSSPLRDALWADRVVRLYGEGERFERRA